MKKSSKIKQKLTRKDVNFQFKGYAPRWNKTANKIMTRLNKVNKRLLHCERFKTVDNNVPYLISFIHPEPASQLVLYLSEITNKINPNNYDFVIQHIPVIAAFDPKDAETIGMTKLLLFDLSGEKVVVYLKINEVK